MTGRELAIYQAADAFELFTGLKPSVAAIGNAFELRNGKPILCCVTSIAPWSPFFAVFYAIGGVIPSPHDQARPTARAVWPW